jgi:hypothetical protein
MQHHLYFGTVGVPKGAMFSFDAFAFAAQNAIERLGFQQQRPVLFISAAFPCCGKNAGEKW